MICGTHVKGCELNPIIFQIFYWEAEVWVEDLRHRLQVRADGVKHGGG
jgi:hypothetical protein